MKETVALHLTEEYTVELIVVHRFANELVLAGDDEKGYEIVHTVSGLGFINGSAEFKSRLMDYGRALSQLNIDWSKEEPFKEIDRHKAFAAQALRSAYWNGYQAPSITELS